MYGSLKECVVKRVYISIATNRPSVVQFLAGFRKGKEEIAWRDTSSSCGDVGEGERGRKIKGVLRGGSLVRFVLFTCTLNMLYSLQPLLLDKSILVSLLPAPW